MLNALHVCKTSTFRSIDTCDSSPRRSPSNGGSYPSPGVAYRPLVLRTALGLPHTLCTAKGCEQLPELSR